MASGRHGRDDGLESLEDQSFLGQKWVSMEEGNHSIYQVDSPPNHQDHCLVRPSAAVIRSDSSTPEGVPEETQDRASLPVLAHTKLVYQLESESEVGASRYPDRERSFSIGETTEIGFQPSLLIVRFT